jgi:hypothetical protein
MQLVHDPKNIGQDKPWNGVWLLSKGESHGSLRREEEFFFFLKTFVLKVHTDCCVQPDWEWRSWQCSPEKHQGGSYKRAVGGLEVLRA